MSCSVRTMAPFSPPNRRGRLFDFLREDLSVEGRAGSPYTSLVCAPYLAALGPDEVGDLPTVGPAIGRLSTGVGNVAGALLNGSGVTWHEHGSIPHFAWLDGKSRVAIPRLFGGELDPPLAAALMTVQSISASAVHSRSRSLCVWCETAARKHRFVALFQSLTALDIMRRDGIRPQCSDEMMAFVESLNQSGSWGSRSFATAWFILAFRTSRRASILEAPSMTRYANIQGRIRTKSPPVSRTTWFDSLIG